jgi:hypothetical protein
VRAIPGLAWRALPERVRSFMRRVALAVLPRQVNGWIVERLYPKVQRYALAQQYLAGLRGVEIGGSAHNSFDVQAFNIDRYASMNTIYKQDERRVVGTALPIDIVACGDQLPLKDKSVEFVLASHVIEHIPDPIGALIEWERVARRYVFLVVPHRDRTFDAGRPLTAVGELLERHAAAFRPSEDKHWSVWTCKTFLELCRTIGLAVIKTEDPDRKVGNGFAVVIDASRSRAAAA